MEAGTPMPLIAEVAAELARLKAEGDMRAEAALLPSAGALRMRKHRASRHATSQNVTCDASDAEVTENVTEPAPSPLPLLSPQTPQITPTPLPHPEGIRAYTRGSISILVLRLVAAGSAAAIAARPKPKAATAFPCPEGVEPQHWADLLANRKSKRLPNTPTAHKGILRELAKFSDEDWPPGRIVEFAAERGWGAIFDPRQSNGNRNGQRPIHHRPSGNGFLDAVVDAERADRAGPRV